jgi:hypothetical protein
MEQDLLARFTGDSGGQRLQCQSPQSPPSPTLSLCVGFDEEQRIHQAGRNVVVCSCPSSYAPFLSPLVSVVVPGQPVTAPLQRRRPTDLPAACAGARPQTAGQTLGPGSWSDALPPRPCGPLPAARRLDNDDRDEAGAMPLPLQAADAGARRRP